MLIRVVGIAALVVLASLSSVASYLRLLMRRLAPVAARKVFPPGEGGALGADRERIGVSVSALHGALMAAFAMVLAGLMVTERPEHPWQALGVAFLIVLGTIALFDQLIPFVLVARHDEPEKILLEWGGVLRRTVFLALPLTFPVLVSTTINRLLEAGEPEPEPPTAQEDLQELLEVGQQEGLIEKEEGEMLQSVVRFGDQTVRAVMSPRPEIVAIEINSSLNDLRALIREKRYSRVPVYQGTLDNIQGIVSVRDLAALSPETQASATLRSLVRPVPFVPETKRSADLLKEMQRSTAQLAIVIDEYGSVAGLVTLEDLLEEIVGEIRDEVETHERDIVEESARSYVVAGHTELAQIEEVLGRTLEPGEYSTVTGLVLAHLGHVPLPGEKVETQGLTFEVLEANPRTILKVRLKVPPAAAASAATPAAL
jgi:CBS domain containing-hemolysin-like protein